MSDLQQLITTHNTTEQIDLLGFDLPQNYSLLINRLEQLAHGLDSALSNFSLDRREVDFTFTSPDDMDEFLGEPFAAGRAPPPHAPANAMNNDNGEVEFSHVVSDIWIGVILTLLIVSVIFFICSCFLYHKFQQWKNQYRNRQGDQPIEICRRFPADYEAESLPSYTIVSGLPSYDDALEEFRKAGIDIKPSIPIIKIFDSETTKSSNIFTIEDGLNDINMNGGLDNVSVGSTCNCGVPNSGGGGLLINNSATPHNSMLSLSHAPGMATQIIELTPDQLAKLSQKRLSLQIAFNSSVRRNSRPRIDLYREANRNNHLRSRAFSNAGLDPFPQIHRSSSSHSLSVEQNRMQQHMQHRGSLY